MAPDMGHITHRDWWQSCQNVKSLVLTVWDLLCFENSEEEDD